jgi:hypothetical protein
MRDCLERTDLVRWPVGWRLAFDLADVLTLVVTAHGDIDNVLAVWDAAPDPGAAIHMAALREGVLHHTARTHFHSPFLDEFPQAADKIGAFLMRPQTIAHRGRVLHGYRSASATDHVGRNLCRLICYGRAQK